MQHIDILIAGVGGQGILLAGKVLGHAAMLAGWDCKIAEAHGMAQRGGSVQTHVRIGAQVQAPLIDVGAADVLLAFEPMEALRMASMLAPDGLLITAMDGLMPLSVAQAGEGYPALDDRFSRLPQRVVPVLGAQQLALQAGSARSLNVVLLGSLYALLGWETAPCLQALAACTKPQFHVANGRAFAAGYHAFAPNKEEEDAHP